MIGKKLGLLFVLLFITQFAFNENNNVDVFSLRFKDVKNNVLDLSKIENKVTLFLFFNPSNTSDKEKLAYAQVLYNKYNSNGLEIIGISNGSSNTSLELLEYGNFLFPFISDKDKKIHEKFDIRECCGGTILLNQKKEVKFKISNLLNKENLRQLVEKEIFGKTSYTFSSINYQNRNNRFKQILPKHSLLDITSYEIRTLENFSSYPLVMTFISSFCSRCRSGERIKTLMQLEKMLLDKKIKAKLILVFFKPFNERDIHEWENYTEMPFDKYISLEKIFSDEEEYVTDSSQKTDPLTILMMDNKKIEFIENVGMKEIEICKEIEKILLNQNPAIPKSNFKNK